MVAAMNSRGALRVAALFAEDYRSTQPVHPGRGFGGSAQVIENWTAVFDGVPDFVAELVDHSITGNTEQVGWMLYTSYLIPFEIASMLLLVAMIGAIVLAKREL